MNGKINPDIIKMRLQFLNPYLKLCAAAENNEVYRVLLSQNATFKTVYDDNKTLVTSLLVKICLDYITEKNKLSSQQLEKIKRDIQANPLAIKPESAIKGIESLVVDTNTLSGKLISQYSQGSVHESIPNNILFLTERYYSSQVPDNSSAEETLECDTDEQPKMIKHKPSI